MSSEKETLEALNDIEDIVGNISIIESDWGFNIYNSDCSEYGLNVKYRELEALRDKLTELIDKSRQPSVKTGYDFSSVTVRDLTTDDIKKLLKK